MHFTRSCIENVDAAAMYKGEEVEGILFHDVNLLSIARFRVVLERSPSLLPPAARFPSFHGSFAVKMQE